MSRADDQIAELDALTQKAAAHLVGLTDRQLRNRDDVPRNPDQTYSGPALLAWAVERAELEAGSDPMLRGDSSPGLERYRAARAELAEMDLAEKRGQLVRVESIRRMLDTVASLIRDATVRIDRQFGAEAADMIGDALDEADRHIRRQFGDDHEA